MAEKCCTFFGHRQCPESIRPTLTNILEDLIIHHGVTMFYVGNQGAFDIMVRSVLLELTEQYVAIRYAVVLAYLPTESKDDLVRQQNYSDTIYPEGIETLCHRLAEQMDAPAG